MLKIWMKFSPDALENSQTLQVRVDLERHLMWESNRIKPIKNNINACQKAMSLLSAASVCNSQA